LTHDAVRRPLLYINVTSRWDAVQCRDDSCLSADLHINIMLLLASSLNYLLGPTQRRHFFPNS
jgi:hypothetical protein